MTSVKIPPKFIFLTVILPILTVGGYFFAQKWRKTPTVAPALLPKQGKPTKGLVFRVAHGSNTLFLVGSVHMLTKEDYPLPAAYASAFTQAEKVVFEVPPEDFTAERVQTAINAQGGSLDKGMTVPAEQAALGWLTAQNLPKQTFKGMPTWRVATTIAAMASKSVGLDAEQGIDAYFRKQSIAQGKVTDGLERISQQFQIFANLSAETQSRMVIQAVEESATATAELAALLDAWRAGNLTELEARTARSFAECPEAKLAILDDRNAAWWPKIHQFAESPPTELIIVGAAHLAGPQGLIARLQRAGCVVEHL